MTPKAKLAVLMLAGTATTAVVTFASYKLGKKANHEWVGAAIGFFLLAPMVTGPMFVLGGGTEAINALLPPRGPIAPTEQ